MKPQNVLVGDSDDAYLGDFGLTRIGGTEGVTATGKLLGTVSYLAPEVIRGGEATAASDRYAFAAMVFEGLTGTVVYPRRTEAAILFAHTSEPPPRISRRRPELPQALDEVFTRALAKSPNGGPAPRTNWSSASAASWLVPTPAGSVRLPRRARPRWRRRQSSRYREEATGRCRRRADGGWSSGWSQLRSLGRSRRASSLSGQRR